jgi:branched-chain amino acid transport system substrate-binding protein
VRRVAVGLLILTLALAGCSGGSGGTQHVIGTLRIGADLPLSGDDAADGVPAKNAIDLAIRQAGLVCGHSSLKDTCVRLQLVPLDDVRQGIHDPAKAADNIQQLIADPAVVGVVGGLYDSVARSEITAANVAGLALLSPGATDECLTQEPADGHCGGLAARLRPSGANTFFRLIATQLDEGAAAADLLTRTLGKHQVYVVNDQSKFGQAVAGKFAERVARDGGTVVDPSDLGAFDPSQPADFAGRVGRAQSLGAQAIYYAGSSVEAGAALRREMMSRMPQAPMLGTDRLAITQFAKSAAAGARGSYYTVPGPYPPRIREAATFSRDYRRAYGADVGRFSLASFDAFGVLAAAIRRAIDAAGGARPSRAQVLDQVRRTSEFHGAMGTTGFDGRGDTALKLVTAYQWLAAGDRAGQVVAQLSVS